MRKVLDLTNVEQLHTLELTLQAKGCTEKTTLLVTIPTEGLINELESMGSGFTDALARGDKEGTDAAYNLAARLISCNRAGLQVTAEELREKYGMRFESLVVFYNAYLDFINEVTNEKN